MSDSELDQKYQQLRAVKAKYRDWLFSLPNVTGVGIGRKMIGGQYTDERSIRVYVIEKKPLDALSPDERVPPHLDGIPTDVIETGPIVPTAVYTARERPAKGGCSIGVGLRTGTLGVLCRDRTDGTLVVLSNNHVISDADDEERNSARVGTVVYQPAPGDGEIPPPAENGIATLKRWKKFKLPPQWNKIDAAIAQVIHLTAVSPQIHIVGKPRGARALTPADEGKTKVRKVGRTTGYTTGFVDDVACDMVANHGYGNVWLEDQILLQGIDAPFAAPGDSGSAVVDEDKNLVGLLWAGADPNRGIASHITDVFDEFSLDLKISDAFEDVGKFDDLIRTNLEAIFEHDDVPDQDDFAFFVDAVADGIEWHEHRPGGGPGSGTGDAAPVLPKLSPGDKIRDTFVDNVDSWRKLLPSHPHLAARAVPVRWEGKEMQPFARAVSSDGDSLYVGLGGFPAYVFKMDPTDFTILETWQGTDEHYGVRDLLVLGEHLYVALGTHYGRIVKLNEHTLEQVSEWVMWESGQPTDCLATDGTYLFAGHYSWESYCLKMNPDTWEVLGVLGREENTEYLTALCVISDKLFLGFDNWIGGIVRVDIETFVQDGEIRPWPRYLKDLTTDGTYLYAGWKEPTMFATVAKIDPVAMRVEAFHDGPNKDAPAYAVHCFDGRLCAAYLLAHTHVVVMDTDTMTSIGHWIGEDDEQYCYDLTSVQDHIYAAHYTRPAMVLKLDPATMTKVLKWMAEVGEGRASAATCDPPYLYLALDTRYAGAVKLDVRNMTTVARWVGDYDHGYASAIVFDGQFLYVGLDVSPARVVKIAPATMKELDTWIGPPEVKWCTGLLFDGTYLYAALYTDPPRVVKIHLAAMATIDVWETAPGWVGCTALTFDGKCIYVGLDTDPAKVIQVDPATMSTIEIWVGDVAQRCVRALAFDGHFVHAGLYTDPAQVVKIDPHSMAEVGRWLGYEGQDYCQALIFDGEYLCAALDTSPPLVVQIDPRTMATRRVWQGPWGEYGARALTFDGLHTLVGLQMSPAVAYRFIL